MVSHTFSCTLSAAVDNNRALSWKRKGSAEWIVGGGIVRCYDMLHSLAGIMQTVEEEGRNHLKNPSFCVLMENWSYFLKVFHSTKALKCHSEKFKLTCRNRSQDHVKASGIWHQWCQTWLNVSRGAHFQILKEYFGEREDFHKKIFLLYSFTQKTSTSMIVKAVSTLTVQTIFQKIRLQP